MPDLAGETESQGADAVAVADTLAPAEKITLAEKVALPRAKAKIKTGLTRRSQRQRKAPIGQ
jgi:hypothetical protein